MGQPLQAYVIARVQPHGPPDTPPKYRCIAAYHHQWCYGRLPLYALRRFLTLVKQKDNARIIRAEIRSIDGKYGRWLEPEGPKMPRTPCPFTAGLLGVSWTTDLDTTGGPYLSGVSFTHSLLHADTGSRTAGGDAISIIDVTDPELPAYCFFSGALLSATGYVRSFYSKPSAKEMRKEDVRIVEESVMGCIDALEGEEMVTLQTLAEAWPSEYGKGARKALQRAESSELTRSTAIQSGIPSLADVSLTSAVTFAVENNNTIELEKIIWLPGKASLVKSVLQKYSPFPDSGISMLSKALSEEHKMNMTTSLDLSPFDLSPDQVLTVLSTWDGLLEALDLSFNRRITSETLHNILSKVPSLKRLVIMGCTSIVDTDLFTLMRSHPNLFYNLEALMHPSLLQATEPPTYPISFTIATLHQSWPALRGCCLPLFTPSAIVQSLTDLLECVISRDPFTSDMGMAAQAALCATRAPGVQWSERSAVAVPVFSTDVFKGEQVGWGFIFDCSPLRPSGQKWAFLRCTYATKGENVTQPSNEPQSQKRPEKIASDSGQPSDDPPPRSDYEVHDLHGFLRVSKEEGRPPVSDDAVRHLEKLFQHKTEGAQLFDFMTRENVQKILGRVGFYETVNQHLMPRDRNA
ncbi:hypothetical protein AcW2_006816 [Taiwanofungus camphoratus]|nr:hypothetical protein AcW2_006816 [Antrodia cinnamomea]